MLAEAKKTTGGELDAKTQVLLTLIRLIVVKLSEGVVRAQKQSVFSGTISTRLFCFVPTDYFTFLSFQIRCAYSSILRSAANFPAAAMLSKDMRFHLVLS